VSKKPSPMTERRALSLLRQCKGEKNVEKAHIEADEVLCELLIEFGFSKIVEAFREVPKNYA